MKKKNIFLAAVCCLCAMNKAAAYDFSAVNDGQTIYYNIISSTPPLTVKVTFENFGQSSYNGEITIPDTVSYNGNTYTVTAIENYAFQNSSDLTSVTIPNSVATIGSQAFLGCPSLTSITTPNSVITIGDMAFAYCTGLNSVTIGNSVTSIRQAAFAGCSGLTEIYVKATTPPQIEASTFYEVPTDIPVYVCGDVAEYKKANGWKDFTNIQKNDNCDMAMEDLEADIINIYPNPATDNIIISLREMITNAIFTLYDMQGKVLIRQQVSNEDVISVNEFAAGIYLYNISTGKGSINGKIIKQ
jgi:hypothetical protein